MAEKKRKPSIFFGGKGGGGIFEIKLMKTYSHAFRVNHMPLLTEMRVASVTRTGARVVHYPVLLHYLAVTLQSTHLHGVLRDGSTAVWRHKPDAIKKAASISEEADRRPVRVLTGVLRES